MKEITVKNLPTKKTSGAGGSTNKFYQKWYIILALYKCLENMRGHIYHIISWSQNYLTPKPNQDMRKGNQRPKPFTNRHTAVLIKYCQIKSNNSQRYNRSWPWGVYARNASLVQHQKINQCSLFYQQIKTISNWLSW